MARGYLGYSLGNPLSAYADVLTTPQRVRAMRDVARIQSQGRLAGIGLQQAGAMERARLGASTRWGLKTMDIEFQTQKMNRDMEERWADLNTRAQHYKNLEQLGLMDKDIRFKNLQYLYDKLAYNIAKDEEDRRFKEREWGLKYAEKPYEINRIEAQTKEVLSRLGLNIAKAEQLSSQALRARAAAEFDVSRIPYYKARTWEIYGPRAKEAEARAIRDVSAAEWNTIRSRYYPIETESRIAGREAKAQRDMMWTRVAPWEYSSRIGERESRAKTAEIRARAYNKYVDENAIMQRVRQADLRMNRRQRLENDILKNYMIFINNDPDGEQAKFLMEVYRQNKGKHLQIGQDPSGNPVNIIIDSPLKAMYYLSKMIANEVLKEEEEEE